MVAALAVLFGLFLLVLGGGELAAALSRLADPSGRWLAILHPILMGSLSVLVGLLALLLAAIWALWSGEVALVIRDSDFVYGPTSLLSGRTNTRVQWKDVVEVEHFRWYWFLAEKQLPGIHVRY